MAKTPKLDNYIETREKIFGKIFFTSVLCGFFDEQ